MATPASPSPLRLPGWLRRLRPGSGANDGARAANPLRAAGDLLRDAREAKGLPLRDLAQRTRISIAVLEALEGGWKERLPEAAYLRSMLPLLERHLNLPAESLTAAVLPHASRRGGDRLGRQAPPLSLGALHLLASWQSTLLYGLLILGLLYGVNLQQRRLAAMGQLAGEVDPLAPRVARPLGEQRRPIPFAELHPLAVAERGQAMELLAGESQRREPDLSLGVLTLQLSAPTDVALRGPRGVDTELKGVRGTLTLPVLPPFELRLSPEPPATAVRWRGQPLARNAAKAYLVPVTPTPAAGASPPPAPDPAPRGGPSRQTP
ncbi:MAG: helix-turn-helix transcriptional regulator [Cyanobacteriota bacterium]|nr:helix-turn-helix transcriptional regulator [Cyanobacteriota bacterium]